MKKVLLIVLLFILFAVLSGLNDSLNSANKLAWNLISEPQIVDSDSATYSFQITADSLFRELKVTENIRIPENTSHDIILNWLPAKIFNSPRMNEYNNSLSTTFVIEKITSGDEEVIYKFSDDSTKIIISDNSIKNNTLSIDYTIVVPMMLSDFGKASGKEFYFFGDWYAKLAGMRKSGYKAKFDIPERFTLSGNLNFTARVEVPYQVSPEFTWFAGEEMEVTTTELRCDNCSVQIEVYSQREKTDYSQRTVDALVKGIKYLEKYIDDFPYSKLVVVDFPRTFYGEKDYPGVITSKSGFISPRVSGMPEIKVFEGLSRQYFGFEKFYNSVQNRYVYYSLNDYMSELLYEESFGTPANFFSFAEFYPIPGLLFLAYNQIPVLYTLGDYEMPRGARHLPEYYHNRLVEKIVADTSSMEFSEGTRYKAALSFLSVEKSIGTNKHLEILKDVYRSGTENDFSGPYINNLKSLGGNGEKLAELFTESGIYSYRIDYLVLKGKNLYELKITRIGDGVFPIDIKINTESGSFTKTWSGDGRYKIFTFTSEEKVESAEIDPQKKNMLDVNFTDNSYTLDAGYIGSWSISMRWFFWIQNALMIMGSVG